jgi:hypothetical protein
MSRYRRYLFRGIVVLCMLSGLAQTTARASFDTTTPPITDYNSFRTSFATAFTPVLVSNYAFGTSSGDGNIISQVYTNGAGLYAYVYQAEIHSTSSVSLVKDVDLDWTLSAFNPGLVGVTTSPVFEVTTLGTGIFTLPSGFSLTPILIPPKEIIGTDNSDLDLSFLPPDNLTRPASGDQYSDMVVVFSTSRPRTAPASVTDTTAILNIVPSPLVPAPEPSAMALWGLSGLGVAAGAAFRRFRVPPVKMA